MRFRPNDTVCHLDIPMHGCSLFLDDEPVVLDRNIAEENESDGSLKPNSAVDIARCTAGNVTTLCVDLIEFG